jgi:signal transduction histidine kinase
MRRLSGAEFVVVDGGGRVERSTLNALQGRTIDARAGQTIGEGDDRYLAVAVTAGDVVGDRPRLLVLYSERAWRQARIQAAAGPVAVGLVSLGILAAVTGWVAIRIGRRIEHVERQVARIADGDLAAVESVAGRDEVASLARSVNRMAGRLAEMQAAIRRSERSRLLAQLAAGWAHQLRNALTGARISVQLHARRCTRDDDEALGVALRQLEITEQYVRGLLDLGQPEGRLKAAQPRVCDASALAEEVVRLARPVAEHLGISLATDAKPGGMPEFGGDPSAVRAALLNLVVNAIEAAGGGGSVGLVVRHDTEAGRIRFDVTDDGAGPAAELAGLLFEPFVTSKLEGVGLGLAVARQVAEQHGGTLTWERVEGRTRFRLALPVSTSRLPVTSEPMSATS